MQLSLFPSLTYAELCQEELKTFFRCAICFKKRKRGTGIGDKFCSEKCVEVDKRWSEELEECMRMFGIC